MKKFLKSLFKVSMGFLTIGTVLIIAGLLFGGAGELSKEVTELVHVIRTGVSESVERIPLLESITNINGFTLVVDKDEVSVKVNEEYETIRGDYKDEQLADASTVQNMNISILNGNCYIYPSENGYYGVESRGAEDYQCYVENGTLYLNAFPKDLGGEEAVSEIILYVPVEKEHDKVILFCSADKVTLDVPLKGKELNISSLCGENQLLQEVDFDETSVTVGIGNFTTNGLCADNFNIEVSTADAEIKGMDVGTMSVSLGMGTLRIQGHTDGDITLNCGMGNFEMSLDDTDTAYNYDISGSAESVQIGTDTLAGMVMERWIDNGADKKIEMTCAMGSVKIEFDKT